MERQKFEKLVVEAIQALPEIFQRKLENVDIVVEEKPTPEQAGSIKAGRGDQVLGLYQGIPLLDRTVYYSLVMPDKITIFKQNIEKAGGTDEQVKELVRHTVQHELAHHFGFTDQELKDSGLY